MGPFLLGNVYISCISYVKIHTMIVVQNLFLDHKNFSC